MCREGFCLPGGACTEGTEGCACRAGDACDGGLECQDGVCQQPGCPVGALGCACGEGDACDAGLECRDGTCAAPAGSGVVVGHVDVRACDIVFEREGATVLFAGGVRGVVRNAGARVAFSFTAREDAPLTTAVASIVGVDGNALDLSGLAPSHVACFDRHGAPVSDPALSFE